MTSHRRGGKSLKRDPQRQARRAKKARRQAKLPGGERPRAYRETQVLSEDLAQAFFGASRPPRATAHSHGPRDWTPGSG